MAIDRCWPILQDGVFVAHNPAIILFPKPEQLNAAETKQLVYKVGKKKPYKDRVIKKEWRKKNYKEFFDSREKWSKNDRNEVKYWKEFVKVARYFNITPLSGNAIYVGHLHDCYKTQDTDKCKEPTLDKDGWIQHCFGDPGFLGEDRLFIELNVKWDDWIDDCAEGTVEERGDTLQVDLDKKPVKISTL